VNGTLDVQEKEVLKLFVGGQGANASALSTAPVTIANCYAGNGAGGYGGGGSGGVSGPTGPGYAGAAGGGGGATIITTNGAVEFVAGGGGGTGQGGAATGFLQSGVSFAARPGSGGAGGGGVNRPDNAHTATANGFAGSDVGNKYVGELSGAGGGTDSLAGAGGAAGLSWHGPGLDDNVYVSAASAAGSAGDGPATAAGAASGGKGAGTSRACPADVSHATPAIEYSEGGGGGGGYYGGGGGGCGEFGGGGGGGGSSYAATDVISSSFANLINPPVAGNEPTLGGHYSNVLGGLASISFAVCSENSSDSNVRAHDTAHASPAACPLTVTVKAQNASRAGLAIDNDESKYGPVNFTSETTGGGLTEPASAGQKCESGCTNLLVTVTDPKTKKPVTDASVEAKVALTTAPAHLFGDEFLCEQSEATVPKCGTDLQDLSTDAKGQVHLIYWAPGFVPSGSVPNLVASVDVTATESCSSSVCTAKERKGTGSTSLTVAPYKIYDSETQLSASFVDVLVDLATEKSLTINPADTLALHQMTEPAIEYFEATEREAIANLVRLPAAYGEVAIEFVEMGAAIAEYGEAAPLTGAFIKALDLSPIGINEPRFEKQASGAGVAAFWTEIGGGLGSFAPLSLKGVLATDGEELAKQSRSAPSVFATPPETVDLNVYDVTHCDMSNPNCGPGYSGSTGIQPELCFTFEGTNHLPTPRLDWSDEFCAKTYDPVAWVESQNRLNRALPGK
jgi:hypothetical protein